MRNLFPENKVLKKIQSGEPAVGYFNYIKDVTMLDIAGQAGVDFVILDSEHAANDRETIEHLIIACQLNEVLTMVRVPDIIPWLMRNYMEMGAQAILVPHINSREDCKRAQEALRYPPKGTASCCRSIRSTGFQPANWMDYLDWVENVSFIPLIEDPAAMDNLDGILEELQPGRDMVMFGKADYGQALGTLNRDGTINSAVTDAYYKVIEAAKKHNIFFMACPSASSKGEQTPADVQKVIDDGSQAVVLNADQMIVLSALTNLVDNCKGITLK